MNETPLDRATAPDHHSHEARIIRLEVNVDNLDSMLPRMQERMAEEFRSLHALIREQRDSQQQATDRLRAEFQHSVDKLSDKIDKFQSEANRERRWLIGFIVGIAGIILGNTGMLIGLVVRLFS
jgi:hypothetical protein